MSALVPKEKQFSRITSREISRSIQIVTPEGRVLTGRDQPTNEKERD